MTVRQAGQHQRLNSGGGDYAQLVDDALGDVQSLVLSHPAALLGRASQRARSITLDPDALLARARGRAFNPDVFEAHPPFFFPAECSSNRLDCYSTRMRPSSLQNYATEAEAGVGLMVAHRTYASLPVGSSLTGEYIGPGGNGVATMRSSFYTVPGLDGGDLPTGQVIFGVETGIYSDVSIGFYGGRFICSIDGLDIFQDWRDCPHIPGRAYEVAGKDEKVVCIADIEDAHLSEVSLVYDGATPGAAVLKAVREAEAGRLRPEDARFIESRYRQLDLRLIAATRRQFTGHTADPEEEETMSGNARNDATTQGGGGAAGDDTTRGAGAAGAAATGGQGGGQPPQPSPASDAATGGQQGGGAAEGGERNVVLVLDSAALTAHGDFIRALLTEAAIPAEGDDAARVRLLVARAQDGVTYRRDLIDAALKEGVRAHGAAFNQEAYRRTLENSSIDVIKLMSADWKRAADATFGGGRRSSDEAQGPEATAPTQPDVPDSAYRARAPQ